ncbi:MAG TPA: rhodanese-like domain-containing protein [Hyphomicrobiaceae bacterium]|nr:rhodanese-like domain-containing protein [Hyphomicrobiaceae bacterium]
MLASIARAANGAAGGLAEIDPLELSDVLGTPHVIVLDCRSTEEHEVSHIAGAHRVDPDWPRLPRALDDESLVVCACAVGLRSAAVAAELIKQGLVRRESCRNLAGGLFAWHNAGLPLVDASGPAARIHAYSRLWLPLLERRELSVLGRSGSVTG